MWKDEEDQPFTEAVSDTICCWIVALKLNLCLVYVLKEIVLKMSNSKMFAGGNGIEVKVVIVLNLKKWNILKSEELDNVHPRIQNEMEDRIAGLVQRGF